MKEKYIKKIKNKLDWEHISKDQILSEDFIREFKDKVNWWGISAYQVLSEEVEERCLRLSGQSVHSSQGFLQVVHCQRT